MRDITIVSDPLITDYGSGRPSVLIAKEFSKRCKTTIISTIVSSRLLEALERDKIKVINLGIESRFSGQSITYFEYWFKEALFSLNSQSGHMCRDYPVDLNFSNTFLTPSRAWYAQGPMSVSLEAISSHLSAHYRVVYFILKHLINKADDRLISKFAGHAKNVVANSNYTKQLYQQFGVLVSDVIPEPVDLKVFKPTTSNPSGDYVLSYLGKETDLSVLKEVADRGLRLKLFGSKLRNIPKAILTHPHIEILEQVNDQELADLYSNALFTLFPFIDEPFGYIPTESMACGTPVLTYDRQGPAETVLHKEMGWLVNTKHRMTVMACKLWNERNHDHMRACCVKWTEQFDASNVAKRWMEFLEVRT